MIGNERVLAIVPARSGSKGLPRKNLRLVGGRPLISWTIAAAKAAKTVDRVILSSDDPEVITIAREAGCEVPFVRPAPLATDTASMLDVVHHAIAECGNGFAWIALLQPTSPLRSADDIDATIRACHDSRAPACVTVAAACKSPFWMFFREADGRMRPVIAESASPPYRRQELRTAYALNGAVYVARREWLAGRTSFLSDETISHVMPRERSIDVDTEMDLKILNALVETGETIQPQASLGR
jgi:CMP-N,N'-diacetyllegionaminic acid synthase